MKQSETESERERVCDTHTHNHSSKITIIIKHSYFKLMMKKKVFKLKWNDNKNWKQKNSFEQLSGISMGVAAANGCVASFHTVYG